MKYVLLFLSVQFLFSCNGNDVNSNILPAEKMEDVLWDVFQADAFTTDFISRDSSKNLPVENVKMQLSIFKKHKITKDIFYNSYNYYRSHPEKMKVVLDSMITKQRREEFKRDTPAVKTMM